MSTKQTSPSQFLNGPNYQQIVGFLRQRYSQKLGMTLPERMDTRIQNTVQHYMKEVSRTQSTNLPVQVLNQEVLKETTMSLDNWLRKQESSAPPTITSVGTPSRNDDFSRIFEESNRVVSSRLPPPAQDAFEEEDPVVLMQRMQKQRDEQARALGIAPTAPKLEIRDEPIPSAMNPVPPQADAPPPLLAPRPQDYIIPQEDIVKYRETEYNIFLTSSDRDWFRNTGETRYNFSVNFNTGTKRQGFPFNAALQERFRNIQRIEFVKAIVPVESLATLPRVIAGPAFDLTRVINVFSLPFVGVRIAELNNNGFSTKPEEDNTFAIVQYDTTWSSDLTAQNIGATSATNPLTKSGYTGFIPKFLKTQKVYTPAPLATLQKLSIRMERHNGDLLSDDSDVWTVERICFSGISGAQTTTTIAATNNSLYKWSSTIAENAYIFIQTNKFFPFSAVAEGDNIVFQGYTPTAQTAAALDFQSYINRAKGHIVVATAYTSPNTIAPGSATLADGRNNQGYCNVIIIQNRFDDPSIGSTSRSDPVRFGGTSTLENTFGNTSAGLDNVTAEPNQTNCALINLSRQTHVVLRIITRDMDSSSNIRPDNV